MLRPRIEALGPQFQEAAGAASTRRARRHLRLPYVLAATAFAIAFAPGARAQSTAAADFQARCGAAGVVKCVSFDTSTDATGAYGDNSGVVKGDLAPVIDSAVSASGGGSLKFTINSNSYAGSAGSYFTNFSKDLSVQFGQNSEFYVQWRQRFSASFLNTVYEGGNGWKQIIIGTGDQPGGKLFSSCSDLETVVQNTYHRGFPQMYNSCSGSASHRAYDSFEQGFGTDFKLQNARPSPYCLYTQYKTSYFPPSGNCFGYAADEWMTFQVRIKTGPWVNGEWQGSYVQLWVARDGKPSELVIDWGPYNLTAGNTATEQLFGKVWLLPYNTNKSTAQTHPTAYTWYDELIISRNRIADPSAVVRPNPPTNLTVR